MEVDSLNARIGVLTRREVEARLLAPLLVKLCTVFDREQVLALVRETIIELAHEQGETLAQAMGGRGSAEFALGLEQWTRDDALRLTMVQQNPTHLDFNVTRCRYAELYQALGIPELGALLSCNRDFALIAGFNPQARLMRTQTLMQGAPCCDFRYMFPVEPDAAPTSPT